MAGNSNKPPPAVANKRGRPGQAADASRTGRINHRPMPAVIARAAKVACVEVAVKAVAVAVVAAKAARAAIAGAAKVAHVSKALLKEALLAENARLVKVVAGVVVAAALVAA